VHPAKEVHRAREDVHPAKEAPSAPAVETKPASRRRSGSSEPRLERIVVAPDGGEAATEDATASGAPVRKGWWQRKLGGE
jgi:ribonuclease E